jgi:hypothetical protein
VNNVEEMIREARDLNAQIADLTAQKEALIEKLKTELAVGEKVVVDGVAAGHRQGNRKFDVATALKLMPEDVKLKCIVTEPRLDEKLVRQFAEQMGIVEQAKVLPDSGKTVFSLAI